MEFMKKSNDVDPRYPLPAPIVCIVLLGHTGLTVLL